MDVYIKRDEILKLARTTNVFSAETGGVYQVDAVTVFAVETLPVADVAPVRHGRWIYDEENECYACSKCETSALNNYRGLSVDSNYCPYCGAKMDEEKGI